MVVEERDTLRRRNLLDDEVGLVGARGVAPSSLTQVRWSGSCANGRLRQGRGAHDRHRSSIHGLMDPTVDAMLTVYAAALRRHQQHLEDGCDRGAWHVLACPWGSEIPIRARTVPVRSADAVSPLPRRAHSRA